MNEPLERRAPILLLVAVVAVVWLAADSAVTQEIAPDTTALQAEAQPDSASAVGEDAGEAEPVSREAAPAASELTVLRAYICKGIEQSEPTEAGKSFMPASDGVLRLCTFSEIGGPARQDTVFHVWYWGDREMARVPLGVRGARWRTWSTKQILDEWQGEWHVDIVDRAGVLLSRLEFSVE